MEGTWPENDIRRAFVAGAKWWEYHSTGASMWNSDVDLAEAEAMRRYGSQQSVPADADGLCRCGKPDCENCGDGLPALSQ